MDRDSVFGEQVIWRGHTSHVSLAGTHRVAFWTLILLAAVTTAMAVAVASTLHVPVGRMLLFSGWCATFAMALRFFPQVWHGRAEYLVTDRYVVWKRGRYRRSIERAGITYARIHWYPGVDGVGDLELVRDVPTGALHRRLTLLLRGVTRPDRLWDVIRGHGLVAVASPSSGSIGQRLVEGERVVWSGKPLLTWRGLLPQGTRHVGGAVLGLFTAILVARGADRSIRAAHHVLDAGVAPTSLGFIALVCALGLSLILLLGLSASLLWTAVIQPWRAARRTRYLITDRRVVISEGSNELHLDRSRIVDVIDAPTPAGAHDLFLILDGPRSRAVAVSGAFDGATSPQLAPVLRHVVDSDVAERILRPPAPLPRAA
jgi:hypothetical protein